MNEKIVERGDRWERKSHDVAGETRCPSRLFRFSLTRLIWPIIVTIPQPYDSKHYYVGSCPENVEETSEETRETEILRYFREVFQ